LVGIDEEEHIKHISPLKLYNLLLVCWSKSGIKLYDFETRQYISNPYLAVADWTSFGTASGLLFIRSATDGLLLAKVDKKANFQILGQFPMPEIFQRRSLRFPNTMWTKQRGDCTLVFVGLNDYDEPATKRAYVWSVNLNRKPIITALARCQPPAYYNFVDGVAGPNGIPYQLISNGVQITLSKMYVQEQTEEPARIPVPLFPVYPPKLYRFSRNTVVLGTDRGIRLLRYPDYNFEEPPVISDYLVQIGDAQSYRISQMQVCLDGSIVVKWRDMSARSPSELIAVIRMNSSGILATNHPKYSVERLSTLSPN
jgi:hypothetical protein